MRAFKEAFIGELEVVVPLGGEGLGENTDDRLVSLSTHMVAAIFENWLAAMAA